MQKGNISKLYVDKQYGFILTHDGVEALFHHECLWNTAFSDLAEGQEVEFEIQPAHKGFLAFHIRLVSEGLQVLSVNGEGAC